MVPSSIPANALSGLKIVCGEQGQPFTRADFVATFGQRNPEIVRILFGSRFDERGIAELGERKEVLYRAEAARQGVGLLPGVRALLDDLHRVGFRQAIPSRVLPCQPRPDPPPDRRRVVFQGHRRHGGYAARQAGPTGIPCGRSAPGCRAAALRGPRGCGRWCSGGTSRANEVHRGALCRPSSGRRPARGREADIVVPTLEEVNARTVLELFQQPDMGRG